MKTQSIRTQMLLKKVVMILLFIIAIPLYADPGLPGEGDPGETPAPISDYWWVLALIGIYFIYKRYQMLQKQ